MNILIIIVLCGIGLSTMIVLEKLLSKEKLQKGILYWSINIIGFYIPIVLLIIYISYLATDSIKDNIIVANSFTLNWIIISMELKYAKTSKINWIILPYTLLLIWLLYLNFMYHTFVGLRTAFPSGYFGAILGCNIGIKLNRKKLIATGIITTALIFAVSLYYMEEIELINKPIRYAIDYAEDKGYQIDDNSSIYIYPKNLKTKEIQVNMYIKDKNGRKEFLKVKYYHGQVEDLKGEDMKIDEDTANTSPKGPPSYAPFNSNIVEQWR